jgi:acetyl-CoA carboxylase carboxyltransferase component
MESDSAIQALHGPEIARQRASGQPFSPNLERSIGQTKADYERWLDATYAAARGHVDAIVDPVETRPVLSFLLEVATCHPRRRHVALDLLP